jgi:tetrapyrrole methylase family protein/MazG family protein
MEILRSEGGCPWDREQTHESIRMNFIEETYEVIEAIDRKDTTLLREELGDVLIQVVFHAQIEKELGSFNIDDVADGVCKKLILRHPHIFGDVKVSGSGEVLENWDNIKRCEKGQKTHFDALDSVARSLPALMRAEKLQAKAKKAGFDWPSIEGAFDKLGEEIGELKLAISEDGNIEEEIGDLLFSVVNVARFLNVNPELALDKANNKFLSRFGRLEKEAEKHGDMRDMNIDELDKLWERIKTFER